MIHPTDEEFGNGGEGLKKRQKDSRDDLLVRVTELEQLLTQTTELGRQFEFQRRCFVQAAASALGLLKFAASAAGTVEDRAEALLALSNWLTETAANQIPPITWVGSETPMKH